MDADNLSNFDSDLGSRADPSVDTISSFIADWVQIKYFYSEAASLAQELCETLLASNAIRAIVTYRVKQDSRLEAKLRERVRKLGREYRSAREIRDDIVDLAGVRIALYFPSDREKIDKIIHDAFTDVKHKTFPEQDEKRVSDSQSQVGETSMDFQQRFHGYSADHYRVRMIVENLATKKLRDDFQKTNPVIEIQVASVLMHAWAEIDHDLVYKTLTSGPASQQELRLLDATNGLVHTGEVLLQQLQTAMDDRVAYQNKPFSEQYELLSFLRGQIKKAKGSMEHLDILLLVLKITNLDSPRKLGETLEGFIGPHKSADLIALTLLEHILNTLGEEQRRENNLYLRSSSVVFNNLEIDKKDSKCYATNSEICNRILIQRGILEMAVCVADILRFPEKSILVVEGMPQKFRKFYALYSRIHFATIKEGKDNESWLCEISLKELDPLWTWFETNEDVLFRVSLMLARMNVEDIDQELIKLRPSSGLQRLSPVRDPNQGYMSPRISSPSIVDSGIFSQRRSHDSKETNPGSVRSKSMFEGSTLNSQTGSLQEEQNTTRKRTPLVPEHRRKSTIKEEEEEGEEEDEPSIVLVAERMRRPYNGSPSQQQARKVPEQRTAPPPTTTRRSYYGSSPQQEAQKVPEQRTAPPPTTTGRPHVPYIPPRIPRRGAESTRSMPERKTPEEMDDQPANAHGYQRTTKYKRMSTHHEAEESSDSSEEEAQDMKTTKKPGVKIHQSPHLEVPEQTRGHVRFQATPASMPDYQYPQTASVPSYEYPRTNESYTPNQRLRSRFDSVSERRHSERSQPARSHENRYYREPHLGYQYPSSARRQQPYDRNDDPVLQSTGW